MEENRMESTIVGCAPRSETMVRRLSYVPPRMDVYAAEPSTLLAGTTEFRGWHDDGQKENNSGGNAGNGDVDIVTGAKAVILGQEFSFSDVWEE